jgi:hypothetical protein
MLLLGVLSVFGVVIIFAFRCLSAAALLTFSRFWGCILPQSSVLNYSLSQPPCWLPDWENQYKIIARTAVPRPDGAGGDSECRAKGGYV